MRKVRKLLLIANVSKEHVCKFHIPVIKHMKEAGWRVDVACRLDKPVPECDNAYDLPCDRNPFKGGITESIKILKRVIQENGYDAILCNTVVGSIVGRVAAAPFRKKGLKVFYLNHGMHFFPGASLSRWMLGLPMEKMLACKTDVLITINSVDCATARKYLKIPVIEQIHGMGVDLRQFRNTVLTEPERENLRMKIGIAPDDFVLSYVAEINENKNQLKLLEVLARVRRAVPNAKLLLIGPEHDGGALRRDIEERRLQNSVIMLGWRNDVPVLLRLADVYVASSKSEGLGINLIEAMACDLPVVAFRNRGHSEIIHHQVNGFLVEQNDCEEMAAHVLRLHDSPELGRAIITKAQEDIQRFETDSTVQKLTEMITRYS